MSVTVTVQLVLDDAALAAIAAGIPVTVPPPVVIPPPVPIVSKRHFGYYGTQEGMPAEVADHTSFVFAPGWDGSGLPLTGPTVLFSPFGDPMDATLAKVKAQGGLHHIIALYPQDEPDVNRMSEAETVAKFEAARAAARAVGIDPPIMVCYGAEGVPGIGHADIVGRDRYGMGPQRIDLRPGQKRFYVPGSCNPWREDPVQYAQAALDDPDAWGVVAFIWLDQWGGTQHLGVRSNGTAARHREAYALLGWGTPAVPEPVTPPPAPSVPIVVTPPTEPFDEAYYLEANPDVAAAVAAGAFVNGWHHFDLHGRAEGRAPVRPPATPAPTPASTPAPKPTGNGWHGDFRFTGSTADELNFNWLMSTKGANYAWNYAMARWNQLGQPLARDTAHWPDGERNRVTNTYAGQGSYGPADAKRVICGVKPPNEFRYNAGKEVIQLPHAVA